MEETYRMEQFYSHLDSIPVEDEGGEERKDGFSVSQGDVD
jgi:hypothetical protein